MSLGSLVTPNAHNPFKSAGNVNYHGHIGQANAERPALRPENDRMDRLVHLAIEKLTVGVEMLKALTSETDQVKAQLKNVYAGGDPSLREQLRLANMEIHRLRTLLIRSAGSESLSIPMLAEAGVFVQDPQQQQMSPEEMYYLQQQQNGHGNELSEHPQFYQQNQHQQFHQHHHQNQNQNQSQNQNQHQYESGDTYGMLESQMD